MLLFDMDGTLVAHTIFPLAAKFTKAFCQLPETEEEIMAEWMEMAGDLYATDVAAKPGVTTFLDAMQARGERMAVVTSAVPVHCKSALSHLGLDRYFERVFFAQELGMEKKEPALWRAVAEALGVTPEECVVFDDSVAACRGAKAAGMKTVGVHDPFFAGTEGDMKTLCDRYISGWDELL